MDDGLSGTAVDSQFLTPLGVSSAAERLYSGLIGSDGIATDTLADRTTEVDELARAGLVQETGGLLVAVPVRLAVERWVAAQEARILSARYAANHYAAMQRTSSGGFIEVLRGVDQTTEAFDRVQRAARHELLCFDREPHFSPVAEQAPLQPGLLAAGIRYKVVYHPDMLEGAAAMNVVRRSIALGEEARTSAAVPVRMVVADDSLGMLILPYGEDAHGVRAVDVDAVVVHPSTMLLALTRMFHTVWGLALPVADPDVQSMLEADPAAEPRRVLTLLAAGMTDAAIARELGVSERTVHRRVNRLQELLGAHNRFTLAIQAVRRGWL